MKFPVRKPITLDGKDYAAGQDFEAKTREAVKHLIGSGHLGEPDAESHIAVAGAAADAADHTED